MSFLSEIHWEQPWILALVPLAFLLAWQVFRGKGGRAGSLRLPKVLRQIGRAHV